MMDDIKNKQVIILCGISGSGKTYFSKLLEREGYFRLSLDEYIWSVYGSGFPSLPAVERKNIFVCAAKELDKLLAEYLRKGEKVVVDSTMCKVKKREETVRLCREFGAESLIVYLNPPLRVLKERLSRRLGHGPDDQIVSENELESYYDNFEPPTAVEYFLEYSGEK